MKRAGGPLLFLGACRITSVLGESIENAPVAEGLGNIPQTHNRPRKGGTRANAVVRQALWSHTAPRRLHDASVPANPEIRLTNLTTYNQRPNPPPRQSSHPCLVLKGRPLCRLALAPAVVVSDVCYGAAAGAAEVLALGRVAQRDQAGGVDVLWNA